MCEVFCLQTCKKKKRDSLSDCPKHLMCFMRFGCFVFAMEWLCFNGLLASINGVRQLCRTLKAVWAISSVFLNCLANIKRFVSDGFQLQFDTLLQFLLVLFVFPHSFYFQRRIESQISLITSLSL